MDLWLPGRLDSAVNLKMVIKRNRAALLMASYHVSAEGTTAAAGVESADAGGSAEAGGKKEMLELELQWRKVFMQQNS